MAGDKSLERLENPTTIGHDDASAVGEAAASQPDVTAGGRMQRTMAKYKVGQLITMDQLISRVRGE